MKQVLGIAYGEHELQRLDLYLPEKDYFPVFVYFHGGGMEKGDKEREKDIAAALAPADPSSQDSRVAALAGRMESEARIELARLAQEETMTAGSSQGDAARRAYQVIDGTGTVPSAPGSGLDLFA